MFLVYKMGGGEINIYYEYYFIVFCVGAPTFQCNQLWLVENIK